MLYYTSKLHSSSDFEIKQDTDLWGQLVPGVERLNTSQLVWKLWIVTDRFRSSDTLSQTYSLTDEWQPAPTIVQIVQTAASYLRVQQNPQQTRTVFTVVSPNQDALENLAALIVNLYDDVTPVGMDHFINENGMLLVRAAKAFRLNAESPFLNTCDDSQRTFTTPIRLDDLRKSVFPEQDWDLMNLSTITADLEGFPNVRELYLNIASHQAIFLKEEQFLLEKELPQMDSVFQLADKIFGEV